VTGDPEHDPLEEATLEASNRRPEACVLALRVALAHAERWLHTVEMQRQRKESNTRPLRG
jgi:hypothetical protein